MTSNQKGTLGRHYSDCDLRLENLNQMRLRDLIGDDEYIKEKQKLLDEKMNIERSIHEFDTNSTKELKLTTETFVCAHNAMLQFKESSPDEKRGIPRSTNAIRTYFMSTGATFPDVMASS